MIKYTIGYKENGQQKNVRAEIKEDSEIMGFIAALPADNNALLKKVEDFSEDDLNYPLLGEKKDPLVLHTKKMTAKEVWDEWGVENV